MLVFGAGDCASLEADGTSFIAVGTGDTTGTFGLRANGDTEMLSGGGTRAAFRFSGGGPTRVPHVGLFRDPHVGLFKEPNFGLLPLIDTAGEPHVGLRFRDLVGLLLLKNLARFFECLSFLFLLFCLIPVPGVSAPEARVLSAGSAKSSRPRSRLLGDTLTDRACD